MEYVHYKVSKSQNIPCTHDTRQSTAFIKSIIHKSSPSSIYAKLNPIFVQLISIIWHQQFMPYSRIPGPNCNCAAKQKLQNPIKFQSASRSAASISRSDPNGSGQ